MHHHRIKHEADHCGLAVGIVECLMGPIITLLCMSDSMFTNRYNCQAILVPPGGFI